MPSGSSEFSTNMMGTAPMQAPNYESVSQILNLNLNRIHTMNERIDAVLSIIRGPQPSAVEPTSPTISDRSIREACTAIAYTIEDLQNKITELEKEL